MRSRLDSAEFRHVLGRFPSGMVVVAAMDAGTPAGMAIQAFASVSLEPPMIGFFPGRTSSTWPRIERAGRFAVSVLGAEQAWLCERFAARDVDRFAGVEWTVGSTGSPLIGGAEAWIECDLERVDPAGDHWAVLGRVTALSSGGDPDPLVFWRGAFRRLAA